ncbi:FecR domain-containing protein [Trichothermofontia sichuanensis B231]|uniref:FecR domain-containing protein n=1 Tax=Trichothermofontia sichuanensis TaxID=3045816 RepID=UPI00224654D1|nr:FecR domain-containing protein [Trichothermofontia sichuanensis]UZQ55066.1 FecR domain-containing protein [Trichothermofontia sichuanensis B231]
MVRRCFSFITLFLCSTLLLAGKAAAETPLTQAVLETVRNRVQLLRQNAPARDARVADRVVPGEGVATARQSLAELRFNDGSLGRLGERAVFWFMPRTRTFSLSNGTVLLLIPPGQGRTRLYTPNAAAGIQGSALFARYIADSDTTVIGALTDSKIQVFNRQVNQSQTLKAGQMAVAVGRDIVGIYDFDLETFYRTSPLLRGLVPNPLATSSPVDEAIAAVQAEMLDGLAAQMPIPDDAVVVTPDFLRMPMIAAKDVTDALPPAGTPPALQGGPLETPAVPLTDDRAVIEADFDVRFLLEVGELQRESILEAIGSGQDTIEALPSDNLPDVENDRPEQPDIPDTPDLPERPDVSDVPDVSDGSDRPDMPDIPNMPGVPGVPDVSNRPDVPGANDFPGQGNGVEDGFPGQGDGVSDGSPDRGGGDDDDDDD